MTTTSRLTLYVAGRSPNPMKIRLALNALGLEYETKSVTFDDSDDGVKGAPYLKVCGNGRVPALVNHSENDFTVWESGAILFYLGEKFDPEGKLFGRTPEEKALVQQWVYFQASGLGPVQGNVNYAYLGFYKNDLGEEPPTGFITRFDREMRRVYSVLETQLATQQERLNSPWIALDRVTLADFALLPWIKMAPYAKLDLEAYPNVKKWLERLEQEPGTKKAYADSV